MVSVRDLRKRKEETPSVNNLKLQRQPAQPATRVSAHLFRGRRAKSKFSILAILFHGLMNHCRRGKAEGVRCRLTEPQSDGHLPSRHGRLRAFLRSKRPGCAIKSTILPHQDNSRIAKHVSPPLSPGAGRGKRSRSARVNAFPAKNRVFTLVDGENRDGKH